MKKADIWVSAVMYIALGVVVISIILAAGMPVINKLRDKNTILQTKDLMFKLDETIRTVLTEGPGSKRALTMQIGRGDFVISNNVVEWSMESKVILSEPGEPGVEVKEGSLILRTDNTATKGEYKVHVKLDYSNIAVINTNLKKLSGNYNLIIMNSGVDAESNMIKIDINEATV
ncbi:MAG: hypothetical protein AB1571_01855 [Nanoarchaeota archaeon]